MNNIKAIFLIIAFSITVLFPETAKAQYVNLGNNNISGFSKLKTSVSVSSSFTNYGYGTSAFSTTVMPTFSQNITDKFSISAGIGYSALFISSEGSVFNNTPDSYTHLFVSGSYKLSDKITIHGTGYGTFLLNNNSTSIEGKNNNANFSNKGIIMDLEYKVTESFRINVGFEYREQSHPFYPGNGSFMNNQGFGGSSFERNPFSTGYGF